MIYIVCKRRTLPVLVAFLYIYVIYGPGQSVHPPWMCIVAQPKLYALVLTFHYRDGFKYPKPHTQMKSPIAENKLRFADMIKNTITDYERSCNRDDMLCKWSLDSSYRYPPGRSFVRRPVSIQYTDRYLALIIFQWFPKYEAFFPLVTKTSFNLFK